MDVKIEEKKENPFFKRIEFTAHLTFEGSTPNLQEVRKELLSKLGVDDSLLLVRAMNQSFGENSVNVRGEFYKTKEDLLRIAPRYALIRNGLMKKEEKKKEEKR